MVTSVTVNDAGANYSSSPVVTLSLPPDVDAYVTYWSNDQTSVDGMEPAAAVTVPVIDGLFSVGLGDTSLNNMSSLLSEDFDYDAVFLRVWFDDGVSGIVQLQPDQALTSAPYAFKAGSVAPGSIQAESLSPNAVDSASVRDGSILITDIDDSSLGIWNVSNTDIYRAAGNVGIGVSDPQTALQVAAGGDVMFGAPLDTPGRKLFFDSDRSAILGGRYLETQSTPPFESFAWGRDAITTGIRSVALNSNTRSVGNVSFTAGLENTSNSFVQATFGRFAVEYPSASAFDWIATDPLFVIGNGTSTERNNAFTVSKRGLIGVNDETPNAVFDVENRDLSSTSIIVSHENTTDPDFDITGVNIDVEDTHPDSPQDRRVYGLQSRSDSESRQAFGLLGVGTSQENDANGVIGSGNSTGTDDAEAFGLFAIADNDNGTGVAYAVFARVASSTSTGDQYAGFFSGNLFATGYDLPSDRYLKSNLRPSQSESIARLAQLQVSDFEYRTDEFPHMSLPAGKQTGLVAQNVEAVFPELVGNATQPATTEMERAQGAPATDAVHFKVVDYARLVPHLVKAIQEQQAEIELLRSDLEALRGKE